MAFEWRLSSPVSCLFNEEEVQEYEVESLEQDADGAPVVTKTVHEVRSSRVANGLADRVRLVSSKHDRYGERFFVRFIYGRERDGRFDPAAQDAGVVFGGPNYHELMSDTDGSVDENDLLALCAKALGWGGHMVDVDGEAGVESIKIEADE